MFLKILQNSQESTCARVSFLIKLQVSGNCFYKKMLEKKKSSSFKRIYHLFLKKILAKSYECRHGRLVFNNWWIIKIIGRKWRSVFKIDNKNNDAWHLNLMHLHESRKFYTRVNNKKVNFFETAHSYCLFVSLKWFRKVHVRPFFNWWELSLLNL